MSACGFASVCVWGCMCIAANGCLYLGRGVCTRTDREGIELKRMRQIPAATRSLIHTAIVLRAECVSAVVSSSECRKRFAHSGAPFLTKTDKFSQLEKEGGRHAVVVCAYVCVIASCA